MDMEARNISSFVEHDLAVFHIQFCGPESVTTVAIPNTVHDRIVNDTSRTALFMVKGFSGKAWKCRVSIVGNRRCFDKGMVEFCCAVSGFRSRFYLVFEYEGWGMRFIVTRFDPDGHLIRCCPYIEETEDDEIVPLCSSRLEQMPDELLYFIRGNPTQPLVLPKGRFATTIKERGTPATYSVMLETHPELSWVVGVERDGSLDVGFSYGWETFAVETELGGSMCIRLQLVDCRRISAIIFSSVTGTVLLPAFGRERNSHHSIHVEQQSLHADSRSPDSIGGPWEEMFWTDIAAHEHTYDNIQSRPKCLCTLYAEYGAIPKEFVEAHLQLSSDWFIIETMENLATSVHCVISGKTLVMMEGYLPFKNKFALQTGAQICLYLVARNKFVFHRI